MRSEKPPHGLLTAYRSRLLASLRFVQGVHPLHRSAAIPWHCLSRSPCWSCEAWSHIVRCVRPDAKQTVRGLGEPQQDASGNPKGYPDALLAYVFKYL